MISFLARTFARSRHIFLYGSLMALCLLALKWLQWKFLIAENKLEIYIGLIAVLFTGLGTWVAFQLVKSKAAAKEKETAPLPEEKIIDETALDKLNLTGREYEVLQLLAKGHSNAAIAESLFLSLSTVKTHVSNLFVKLDVKSRTQAIEKSRQLKIIA